MTFFFPFIPAPFSLQELITTQPEYASQLKRIQLSFQELKHVIVVFFFLVHTGVKHPYPIVLNRTLPYSTLLEEVNLYYSSRSKDFQRHCA